MRPAIGESGATIAQSPMRGPPRSSPLQVCASKSSSPHLICIMMWSEPASYKSACHSRTHRHTYVKKNEEKKHLIRVLHFAAKLKFRLTNPTIWFAFCQATIFAGTNKKKVGHGIVSSYVTVCKSNSVCHRPQPRRDDDVQKRAWPDPVVSHRIRGRSRSRSVCCYTPRLTKLLPVSGSAR